jgi:hypothetical protein
MLINPTEQTIRWEADSILAIQQNPFHLRIPNFRYRKWDKHGL